MAYYGNQDPWSPSVYGFSLFNSNSKIDKTCITFTMWKTTLKVSIIPAIESGADEAPRYDFKNSVSIWLTPLKAHRFAEILKGFKEDPNQYDNFGVATPQSIITVDKSETFGQPKRGPVISIRKVNEEGQVEASYSYECNIDGITSIVGFKNSNPKDFKQDTKHFQSTEVDAVIAQLENYYNAMTNCTAFSVLHQMYPYLDRIAAKIGVDLSGQSTRRSGGGFFTNNNAFDTGKSLGGTGSQRNVVAQSSNQQYDASALKKLVEGQED